MKYIIRYLSVFIVFLAFLFSFRVVEAYAFDSTDWNDLSPADDLLPENQGKYEVKGDNSILNYGANQTNDVTACQDTEHDYTYYNQFLITTSTTSSNLADSRVMYCKRMGVKNGQNFTIVAAKEDSENSGGAPIDSGNTFYWSILEFDSGGKLLYDGGWQTCSSIWTVGSSTSNGYYPSGSDLDRRQGNVRYIIPIFRLNNGDDSIGGGAGIPLTASKINSAFPIFYFITKPFTYTFDLNGGTYNDSSTYTTERLGLESINAPTPTRDGYVLTGWKITSSEGKQSGKIYTPEQLSSMLKDGNYWSSLFYNATFEALWERLDNTAPTIELNSVSWDTSTSTLKIDAKANDSGYGIMSFVLKDNGIDYSQ